MHEQVNSQSLQACKASKQASRIAQTKADKSRNLEALVLLCEQISSSASLACEVPHSQQQQQQLVQGHCHLEYQRGAALKLKGAFTSKETDSKTKSFFLLLCSRYVLLYISGIYPRPNITHMHTIAISYGRVTLCQFIKLRCKRS